MTFLRPQTPGQAAFTLIELSIVLVIIGLIVGGVLVGRDLIKAAEARAEVSQIHAFSSATSAFRSKYGYLPGDIPVATANQFGLYVYPQCRGAGGGWECMDGNGAITGIGGTCSQITTGVSSGVIPAACMLDTCGENSIFFKHLTDTKLLAGNVVDLTSGAPWDAGVKYVALKSGRGGVVAGSCFYIGDGLCYFLGAATVAGQSHWLNVNATQGAITPSIAQMIDTKTDDGLPTTGAVQAVYVHDTWGVYLDNAVTSCTAAAGSGYKYNQSAGDMVCQLLVMAKIQ